MGFQNTVPAPVGTYDLLGQAISMLTGLGPLPIPVPLAGGPSDYQWAAITNYVVLPQTATTFTFDYQFTAPSNGVLLAIADGGSPAIFDQSNSGTNLLTSDAIPLYPELGAGPHQIVFFLESVSNQPVSVVLSNLKFSYDTRSLITDKRILTNGNVQLTLQGIPALHYSIERTRALGGPWTNIGVVLTSTNGLGVFTDTNSSAVSMFYRADASGPSVSTALTSQTNIVGQSVTLAVAAQGTPTLLYQWLKDGVAIGEATNSSLILSSLATNDTGAYSVIVSNDHGVAQTQIANLTVLLPPSLLVQPLDWTPLIGQKVSLTVQAVGSDPLSYQWEKEWLNDNEPQQYLRRHWSFPHTDKRPASRSGWL
jgi:hypothetical protein